MQMKLQSDGVALLIPLPEYSGMPKRGAYSKKPKPEPPKWRKTFLAQWRSVRDGMTQEELAEKAGVSIGTVSGIESGNTGYSDRSLFKLAVALGVTPGMIIDVDPTQNEPLWALISRASPAEQAQIAKHANVIVVPPKARRK